MTRKDSTMLNDITASGVRRAMSEYDQLGRTTFLTKYGFAPSRGYLVREDGRSYDSKALCGVAHAYDRPDLGPLSARDFSGGSATVKRKLESLGFEVTAPESAVG